jgi:hypothetical protein
MALLCGLLQPDMLLLLLLLLPPPLVLLLPGSVLAPEGQ